MKILTLLFPLLAGTLGALAVSPAHAPQMDKADKGDRQPFAGTRPLKVIARSNAGLTADFSRRGAENESIFWQENFDNGFGGWEFDPTTEVTWSLANAGTSFSTIDAANVNSLFVDGPYQVYKREISSATSPEFTVPNNAMLRCYLYFSLNFSDECALEITISEDDFETSTRLYTSLDQEGEKPSQWRAVAASLDDFTGKNVRLRFTYTYGRNDELFKVGGYMGSFYIDDIRVSGSMPVESFSVMTGEPVEFVDLSTGPVAEWEWTLPGAVPATSTERNPTVYYTRDGSYDVTLTVRDADGNEAQLTRPQMVTVTGTTPTAHILPPATFRFSNSRKYMVAPLATVTFSDNSEGFPTDFSWQFTGVCEDSNETLTADTESVDVNYWFQHDWTAQLEVSNQHGSSTDEVEVSAEYGGLVCNLLPTDNLTNFDLDGRGLFPGSNSMNITRYAEKFSAPSVPSVIPGVNVYFTKNATEELIDQIATIGVHLYTCENGLPGTLIDSDCWCPYELNISADPGYLSATTFEFGTNPVVADEFFIVVDGIPDTTYGAQVAFAMAQFRADGGTAWMEKNGEWIEVSSYFPAGANHTSYAIFPYITHSVMSVLPIGSSTEIQMPAAGGTAEVDFFSYMGYQTPVVDADWCRVVSEPNGMTVDKLVLEVDANVNNCYERHANISLTDGVGSYVLRVVQQGQSNAALITDAETVSARFSANDLLMDLPEGATVGVFTVEGTCLYRATLESGTSRIDALRWPAGIYIVSVGGDNPLTLKLIKK